MGIDKNINEATIDEYLNRPDSVYRDMRMLEDPGNYEAIGGDRLLASLNYTYLDALEKYQFSEKEEKNGTRETIDGGS